MIQEIFRVNTPIRDVADGFALEGVEVLAPALFDPAEANVELDYDAVAAALAWPRTNMFFGEALA